MEYKPYYYQDFAEKFILDNPEAGLLLDMGMGKTVTSLSAADKLLRLLCREQGPCYRPAETGKGDMAA